MRITQELTPGPGSYTPSSRAKSPRCTIGTARRKGFDDNYETSPGPAAYDLKLPYTRGSVFGTSMRQQAPPTTSPGPGTYSAAKPGRGPAYSLRPPLKKRQEEDLPGPGEYSPKKVLFASPRWLIGRSTRNNMHCNGVPGPGAYSKQTKLPGPAWRFGSARRVRCHVDATPGPGTYDMAN